MKGVAPTDYPIQELLQQRFSPYALDPDKRVESEDLAALFEAARWAMSSFNAQPWRYIVAQRRDQQELWERILSVLVAGNQPWAKRAPVLALGIVEHQFEHNGKDNKAALHDLGAASAFLTLEATARGLFVHQMIGIEPDEARREFDLHGSLEPYTGLAIGYRGELSNIPQDYARREEGKRERKPLSDIILEGHL